MSQPKVVPIDYAQFDKDEILLGKECLEVMKKLDKINSDHFLKLFNQGFINEDMFSIQDFYIILKNHKNLVDHLSKEKYKTFYSLLESFQTQEGIKAFEATYQTRVSAVTCVTPSPTPKQQSHVKPKEGEKKHTAEPPPAITFSKKIKPENIQMSSEDKDFLVNFMQQTTQQAQHVIKSTDYERYNKCRIQLLRQGVNEEQISEFIDYLKNRPAPAKGPTPPGGL